MPYRIVYSREAQNHLRDLTAAQRSLVVASIGEQLLHQPTVQTRNRKPMLPNPLGQWELRVRDLRVYYIVEEEPEQVVRVRAIGIKVGKRMPFADEEEKS